MQYIEVFSGIGGYREAFNMLQNDLGIECKCVGHIERDEDAFALYKAHFKPHMYEASIGDIHLYRNRLEKDKAKFDLNLGAMDMIVADIPKERYDMEEKTPLFPDLLWLIERCMPRFVLIEAPNTLETFYKGQSMQHILSELNRIGYKYDYCVTDASKFGVPQFRRRLWIFASITPMPERFRFSENDMLNSFEYVYPNSARKFNNIHNVLDKGVRDLSMWISDQSKEFIFAEEYNGSKLWHQLNSDPAMSLKPNMCKMQRANADNYYTFEFIESDGAKNERGKIPMENWKKIKRIRKLTHIECMRLQGFPDSLFDDAQFSYATDTALYRIVAAATNVNQAYAVLRHIFISHNVK